MQLTMKEVRAVLGLTQEQLAQRLAVSVRTVQDYEQPGRRDINRASVAVQRNWRAVCAAAGGK